MVVKLRTTLENLQSKLQASGRFDSVSIGDVTDPPAGVHGAIMLRRYENPATTLNGTIERRIVVIRILTKAFQEPAEDAEFLLDDIVSEILEDIWGEFDLGGTIRYIEPLGVTTEFGYYDIGPVKYRAADIFLPMIVDDSATFAP